MSCDKTMLLSCDIGVINSLQFKEVRSSKGKQMIDFTFNLIITHLQTYS